MSEHRKLPAGFKRCEVCRTFSGLRSRKDPMELSEVARIRDQLRKGLTTIKEVVSLRS